MNTSKIGQLLDLLNEDPTDVFVQYALALEYDKIGDKKAEEYYTLLLTNYPDYLATYYHAGKYFETKNDQQAIQIYKKGIEVATLQKNLKTFNELKNALLNLETDED